MEHTMIDHNDPKYSRFLVELRDSGKINMWGAVPYLVREFPELSERTAAEVLTYWMKHLLRVEPQPQP